MPTWLDRLKYDPVPLLLSTTSAPLRFFTRRDILDEDPGDKRALWGGPEAGTLIRRQKSDGRWLYPGSRRKQFRSTEDYDQLETYRQVGVLVEELGLDRTHPAMRRAAQFLFDHQTAEGDFRGIYGRQYSPNYTAGIMELLVKAGYGEDRRVQRGFRWLLSIRQDDGGWAIPLRTNPASLHKGWTEVLHSEPLHPDSSKPSSHLVTGVVLRAFAAHRGYRKSGEATAAGELLSQRFFKPDAYVDRKSPEYWEKVSFPFWFTDVVSALDSLSFLGFGKDDPGIKGALEWLAGRQARNGLFELKLLRTRDKDLSLWVSLATCRLFKRFYAQPEESTG